MIVLASNQYQCYQSSTTTINIIPVQKILKISKKQKIWKKLATRRSKSKQDAKNTDDPEFEIRVRTWFELSFRMQ